MTDHEIIEQIKAGDHNAFRILVERHQSLVFRTCMGFLHHKEEADDLTQEVFIAAYQGLPKFKFQASFTTWIYRIAVNAALNQVRKSSKNSLIQRLESLIKTDKSSKLTLTEGEDPETMLIQKEHTQWVQKALNTLPENQRTAIVLSKYDDLPQKEIALIMNLTEGAVEALLQRAKANLRKKLSGN